MHGDDGLVGRWNSAPFDYGAMESSELGFLPDGRGWSVFASVSGELSVTRFRWRCPAPGRLVLREEWLTSGVWAPGEEDWSFASVDSGGPVDGTTDTAYTLGPETPPGAGRTPLWAVRFEEAVEFSHFFAREEGPVRPDQDPSYRHVPSG
ncbi:hypothetical protein [Streptomyces coffeae]|uniref:DUF1579 domain-containing protein n=1 Tax=Streptomyces coffeae TaxID=621382 RepID=A0ABS1N852_9ACTN|nr:hypothetical protein [Streptomyces coffeae]MBL1096104.1 hypothetical protein [Streptomyces coffeae]